MSGVELQDFRVWAVLGFLLWVSALALGQLKGLAFRVWGFHCFVSYPGSNTRGLNSFWCRTLVLCYKKFGDAGQLM